MTAVVTPLRRHQPLEAPVLAAVPATPARTPVTPLRPAPVGRPNLVVLDGGRSEAATRRRGVYRRRRLAVALALVGLVALGIQAAPGFVAALTTPPDAAARSELSVAGSTYVAQPGDTLWSVAVALDAGGDVRDVVQRLSEVNGVDRLVVGQSVRIPADLRAS